MMTFFSRRTCGSGLGPINDGQTAVIVGGGPSGVSCAIALKNLAERLHKNINVIIHEGKQFEGSRHYNQCAGVLSPPIVDILERQLKVPFPWHLVHRSIDGYVLHTDSQQILLNGHSKPSYAVRRVTFDNYLLQQARQRGVKIIQSRVTDLEITPDCVTVYSESDNISADVVVGAFGLDDGGCKLFERSTDYRQPKALNSIVANINPEKEFMIAYGNVIHAFLPSFQRIEFGGVTPKSDHLTINIAGADVTSADMDEFLNYPPVKETIPIKFAHEELRYFKGRFPIRPARNIYGDRYVVIGDAAGMMRPFKGKGVNSGCLTGIRAADTIMKVGIGKNSFKVYYEKCSDFTSDLIYGRILRWLTIKSANHKFIDAFIALARKDEVVRTALFNCVSAHKSFKAIYKETINATTIAKGIEAIGMLFLKRNSFRSTRKEDYTFH